MENKLFFVCFLFESDCIYADSSSGKIIINTFSNHIKFPVVLDLSVIIRSYQEFAKENIDIVSKVIMGLMSPFACGGPDDMDDTDMTSELAVWCSSYYFKCMSWPSDLLA